MANNTYFVYMLLCENGSYYTGYTTDLKRRYAEHLAGTAKCKFTRSFKPLKIAQSWECETKSEAMKLENYIKQLAKKEKQKLILLPKNLNLSARDLFHSQQIFN